MLIQDGQASFSEEIRRTLTLGEVIRASGLTERQIRNIARKGLIPIVRGTVSTAQFTFKELLVLRRISQWVLNRISMGSVLSQLADIRDRIPPDQSLESMKIFQIGSYLVIKEGECLWNVSTGQTFLNFEDPPPAETDNIIQFKRSTSLSDGLDCDDEQLQLMMSNDQLSSDDWFQLGIEFESLDEPFRARSAYTRSIALDEKNADAYMNLGRLLQLEDKLRQAKKLYEKVLMLFPDSELANYNLGTIYDTLDAVELAMKYYQLAPNVAMAHHNLARLYRVLGNEVQAVRHLIRSRELEVEEGK